MREFIYNDFVIGFPANWLDFSTVTLAGPPNNDFSPNIVVTRDLIDTPMTADEYAAVQLSNLQQTLTEFELVSEETLHLGHVPAYQRIYRFTMDDENSIRLQQIQVYIVKGTEVLVITATNLVEWFPTTEPLFMEAIRRFRLS